MEEILVLAVVVFVAYIFWGDVFLKNRKALSTIIVPEDSTLRRHFLTQLSNENALVAAKIQKRLAL